MTPSACYRQLPTMPYMRDAVLQSSVVLQSQTVQLLICFLFLVLYLLTLLISTKTTSDPWRTTWLVHAQLLGLKVTKFCQTKIHHQLKQLLGIQDIDWWDTVIALFRKVKALFMLIALDPRCSPMYPLPHLRQLLMNLSVKKMMAPCNTPTSSPLTWNIRSRIGSSFSLCLVLRVVGSAFANLSVPSEQDFHIFPNFFVLCFWPYM